MTIIIWVLLGLTAGLIASRLVDKSGDGLALDMVLGVLGAFIGGAAFHLVGQTGVLTFNLGSLLVSVGGAVVLLLAYHAFTGRRPHA